MAASRTRRRPANLAKEGESVRLEALVYGRVQGVGFRYFVLRQASALGLGGWVANLADGGVQCVAEGPKLALEQLASALTAGPPGARVADVSLHWGPAVETWQRFEVRSGSHSGD
jgi:acylphosphatase